MKNIEKLQTCLTTDVALIESQVNRQYYTGFSSSDGSLIVFRDEAYFLTDFRYIEEAKNQVKDCKVLLLENYISQLGQIFKSKNVKTISIEASRKTISQLNILKNNFKEYEFDTSGFLDSKTEEFRSIKSKEEYEIMQKAANIADECFTEILGFIKVGVSEKQIANRLSFLMREKGAEKESFDIIAISGKNTSKPHGVPTDNLVKDGDFVTMDFGCMYNGYASDMTRTIGVGKINEKMREVYSIVLEAQNKALLKIAPGIACNLIDNVAREYIYSKGYRGKFGHALGHSLGLEIHEKPTFSPNDKTIAREGMLLSVEPGIYLENEFGVRIEDTVYITNEGYINLAKSKKDLIIL